MPAWWRGALWEALICCVGYFLWCKRFHRNPFQATVHLRTESGRVAWGRRRCADGRAERPPAMAGSKLQPNQQEARSSGDGLPWL